MCVSFFKTISSPDWLWFWEFIEFVSIIVVVIGCWGEGWADHRVFGDEFASPLPHEFKKDWWRRFFWRMVVGGLIIELVAFGFSFIGSNREIEGLKTKNLELQAKVLDLEAKAKDRTISEMQSNLFMLLTKDIPKVPIKVFVGTEDNETDRFATKIRKMLNGAGYGSSTDEIIRLSGNGMIIESPSGFGAFSTNALAFVTYGSKGDGSQIYTSMQIANAPPLTKLYWTMPAFSKIGLPGVLIKDDSMLNPNEVGIFVPLKNH